MPNVGPESHLDPAPIDDAPAAVSPPPVLKGFTDIFIEEYLDIHARDPNVGGGLSVVKSPTVKHGLTGIALSGGGIRSATFSLGVLQAINAARSFPRIHYLSTVSGGGYIGTSMTVGMSTTGGQFPFGNPQEDVAETLEMKHLRDNSRYLVPNGLPSVISALVIYLRGITMNILVVVPLMLIVAAALIAAKPDTRRLMSAWGWIHRLPEVLQTSAMPASFLGAGIIAALLVAYAIGVSVFPIQPLGVRRFIARTAAYIVAAYAIMVVFELHFFLLKFEFEHHGFLDATAFLGTIKHIVSFLTPVVVAVLPFVKTLSEKAVSDKPTGTFSDGAAKWGSRIVLLIVAAIVPLLVWLVTMQLAHWGIAVSNCEQAQELADCGLSRSNAWANAPDWLGNLFMRAAALPFGETRLRVPAVYVFTALALVATWPFLNVNSNSLHQLYRDRLGSAFLVRRDPTESSATQPADNFKLTEISPIAGPYHLINTALNVPGSSFANRRGRNADFFIFSRRYVGSEATGYVETHAAERVMDGLNIGTAMAISGAAAAPNMGIASLRPLSPTIALLNVRLGRWMRHPLGIIKLAGSNGFVRWWRGKPGPMYLLREAFFKSGTNITDPDTELPASSGFIFLTDGGHIENLGVYELLRRRCAVIFVVDGEADPEMTSGSLVQLERFARIDLGIRIHMDWREIGERSRLVAENLSRSIHSPAAGPHVALGTIDYPPLNPGGDREEGALIYIKASLSGDENDYILSYKAAHPSFPHETTMDQVFTEEQVEVYRALGEHIARRFISGEDAASPNDPKRSSLKSLVKKLLPEMDPI